MDPVDKAKIREFIGSNYGKALVTHLKELRPPIVLKRNATEQSVAMDACYAQGWEDCVRAIKEILSPDKVGVEIGGFLKTDIENTTKED